MMNGEGWNVYLLECSDNSYYCGITKNIKKRIAQHNGIIPGGARYTKGRTPVKLIGCKPCEGKRDALLIEIKVKKMTRLKKLEFFKN